MGVAAAEQSLWDSMGLTDGEYARICELLGRSPNLTELGMFAVLWSEHCAYKHSRHLLKRLPSQGPRVLLGPGENAGVVDIDADQAIALRIETHNRPSAIEPYQGAATGVGGIVRDLLSQGARPIALLNSLRFGPPTDSRSRYLFGGVVAGISGYGNCIGVPTVAGEVYFEDVHARNPLVNVMCVGTIPRDRIVRGRAEGIGNPVIYVGASTGRDGIHGATFASAGLNEESERRRPAVQVGDPFMEKLLIEACLELVESGAVVGIQDMGAAGLTSSCAETANRAGNGVEIDIALVPRREEGMTSYEVMLSESQERMLVIARAGMEQRVHDICAKWGLFSAVIGRVTDDGMFRVKEDGVVVAEVPARALTEDAPCYVIQSRRPAYLDELQGFDPESLPEPADLQVVFERLLAAPNIASREWIWRQYDHQVQTNTVLAPQTGDAAVLRIRGSEGESGKQRGIAVKTDCNGRHCYLDPYLGTAAAVAEAARNVVCVGAEPIAITNSLNFGNPEDPEITWQLEQAIEGMAAACRALGTPVTGGNASLYNETEGRAIYPTPVIGMIGLLPDVERRMGMGFTAPGDVIVLIGETKNELGGTEYLKTIHGEIAGRPPALDLDLERRVQRTALQAIRLGLVSAAHDCADGGIAIALAEMAFAGRPGAQGCRVELRARFRADSVLFGETRSRILLAVPRDKLRQVREIAAEHDVPCDTLGEVVDGLFEVTIARPATRLDATELLERTVVISGRTADFERIWKEAIPCLMQAPPGEEINLAPGAPMQQAES